MKNDRGLRIYLYRKMGIAENPYRLLTPYLDTSRKVALPLLKFGMRRATGNFKQSIMKRASKNEGLKDFATEANLVECFVGALQSGRTHYGSVQVSTEWDHNSGLVDVLARDCSQALLAFEAKLTDWRRAFLQAYRNAAYANRTYVLLPMRTAHRALQARDEFEFRGIGLCAFDGKKVHVLIEASEQDALLVWIRNRAHKFFNEQAEDQCSQPKRSSHRTVSTARV